MPRPTGDFFNTIGPKRTLYRLRDDGLDVRQAEFYSSSMEKEIDKGSSPASRGGAGVYIEGELGAFYLLAMLAGTEARGLPGAKITSVRFQGVDQGYAMDDLIVEGSGSAGDALLEIQSKRDISFSPNDTTFKEVVAQIARSGTRSVSEDRHQLAVATQRQSKSITGPYQDVLMWSRAAKSSREFFDRVKARGVGSDPMRTFVSTFRANLIAEGIVDDDDTIWKLLRRFAILVFDFESTDPLARLHGLALARQVLADEDVSRAESLWSGLIEISIAIGKVGGVMAREELRSKLVDRNYRLAGDRDYRSARARLADLAKTTLANIGTTVAGVQLNRLEVVATLNVAIDQHRFVELQGGPGVGKSGVLKLVAERVGHESQLIVLDPISTPTGGWLSFAQAIGVPGTAKEFFNDLAASGGGLIVLDGLEMFTDPGRQRTVNDLLREAANVPGFAVVATARFNEHASTNRWIAADVIAAFNGIQTVSVGELTDEEVETLSETTPELRTILAPRHPAANISRNLYRLSRLLKIPASLGIRTEAMLANQWWNSADNSAEESVRAGQRIIARLAEISLAGGTMLGLPEDSAARLHLTRSLTLTEPGRDQFTFYHDVLRDWAIGNFIHEDHVRLSNIDLSVPASPRIARGIELASRLALEVSGDCARWLSLIDRLSPMGAHSSWRRHGLLAIVRSEAAPELLEICSKALLTRGGALFAELVTVLAAVDTISIAELYASMQVVTDKPIPKSLRTNATGTGYRLLGWVLAHANEIPLQAIGAVVNLVEIQLQLLLALPTLASPTTAMLFNWLRQLDLREAKVTIPADPTTERLDSTVRGRMVEDLRTMALLLSGQSPDDAKTYLREIDAEHDVYKVKAIRQFSAALASAAPAELADLIAHSLIEPRQRRKSSYGHSDDRAFNHIDTDYLPASPAQPPFLELLLASPEHGLALVRRLVAAAIESHSDGADAGANGFTVVFDYGPRLFPWTQSYFWSRDQAHEYSAASALKALEAWGHLRLDAGEPVEVVLADILGPDGSSAAYLLVAVDVMISHFPATRSALVPFLANPELIAIERQRSALDQMDRGHVIGDEPSGKVMLADLRAKPSRRYTLERVLSAYISDDVESETLRNRLRAAVDELEPYEEHAGFGHPTFMGRYALNVLARENWVAVEGGRAYRSPPDEAAHLEKLGKRQARLARESEMGARISLAIDGSEYATAATARDAVEHANGDLPDDSDTDPVISRSSRLIATAMLVARDGEGDLLDAHEDWVREVIRRALAVEKDRYSGSHETLRFNFPALGTLALLHLWRRRDLKDDRDDLVSIAVRKDRAGLPAFAAALPMIADKDPRILKAAMRAAFAGLVWRWHPYDEDETVQRSFDVKRSASVQAAVAAEIAWLDGSEEPAWPAFPDEKPIIRSSHRIRVPRSSTPPREDDEAEKASDADTNIHVDSQSAASWLRLLDQPNATHFSWGPEIVEAYSSWSAKINGLGHPPEAETDRSPSEWNAQFYALFAETLMHAPQEQFDLLVEQITALPDEPFGDVAEAVLHAADVLYFNDASRSPERPIELRARMATRTMALWRWRSNYSPGDLSIDHHTGGVVAKILLNTHNPIGGTRSYLVPAVADRLDPLLEPMSPLQVGGPTTFVALCTMNMLLVAPRARHLEFVLAAVEAWFARVPSDAALWITMGIGRKIVDWFEAAIVEEPGLLTPAHPQRIRIDRVLGQLVSVGIAEAYELEKQVESIGTTRSQGRFSQ